MIGVKRILFFCQAAKWIHCKRIRQTFQWIVIWLFRAFVLRCNGRQVHRWIYILHRPIKQRKLLITNSCVPSIFYFEIITWMTFVEFVYIDTFLLVLVYLITNTTGDFIWYYMYITFISNSSSSWTRKVASKIESLKLKHLPESYSSRTFGFVGGFSCNIVLVRILKRWE